MGTRLHRGSDLFLVSLLSKKGVKAVNSKQIEFRMDGVQDPMQGKSRP